MKPVLTITGWLATLGTSAYARCFVDNDIGLSVLPHLIDLDLKEFGLSLGHRRKMLTAIAELAGGAAAPQPAAAPEQTPRNDAERFQLTRMFADFVGPTRGRSGDITDITVTVHSIAP